MFGTGKAVEGSRATLRNPAVCLFGLLWFASIAIGFLWLLQHDTEVTALNTKSQSSSNGTWHLPDNLRSEYIADEGEHHAIVSLHPKCPCTRNSLETLAKILSRATVNTRCTFLIFTPQTDAGDWMVTGTARLASQLPNSDLVRDTESRKALELGLLTSGAAMIVDESGEVLFQGGITSGRSCNAENPGAVALSAILQGRSVPAISPPVFGCALTTPEDARAEI